MTAAATLPSGATVLVEENHDLPLVRLAVVALSGSAEDLPKLAGQACFAGDLSRRGAAGRSRHRLDEEAAALGGELHVTTDGDTTTWQLQVLSRNGERALELLAAVVLRPDLPPSEAAQLRRENLAALDEYRDDDGTLVRRFFLRQLYGATHPYGHPTLGTTETIGRLDEEHARRWLERYLCGPRLLVTAAGAVKRDRFVHLAERCFGVVRSSGGPAPIPEQAPRRRGLHLQLVDKPGRTQTQILFGQPAPRWADPDFLALDVAANAFGGTFTARLMTEVRVKRGLSYGAYCRIAEARGARGITMSAAPSLAQTVETLELLRRLWRDFVEGSLTDEEIAFARDNLVGAYAFEIATPEDRLDLAVDVRVAELPADYATSKVERLRAITPDQVRRAMARHLHPDDLAVTVVATAKKLEPLLHRSKLPFDSFEVVRFDSY